MDLDGTIFWYVAGALVLAALVISFVGIRGKEKFPPSGPVMWSLTAVFALVVVATSAYAVANAAEEKEHREAEHAEEQAHAEEQVAAEGQAPGGGEAAPEGGVEVFEITSPEDGSLSYEPDGVQASAGVITLAYANPSPIAHNVAIEDDEGQLLDESETITDADADASAELAPGEYIFFCTIPGHREGGMEGTLTVE